MNLAVRIFKVGLGLGFCAIFLFVALAEGIEWQRNRVVGVLQNSELFIRHVLLVAGILPLIVALIWVMRFHSVKQFVAGGLVVALLVILHFWVFSVSAHSDAGYVWVQLVEVCAFGCALWILAKPVMSLK